MNRCAALVLAAAFVFTVGLPALAPPVSHQIALQVACPGTYCASLSATISIGGGAALQPVLAVMSTVQVVAAAVALFQAFALLVVAGSRVPASLLEAIEHVRGPDAAPSRIRPSTSPVFWLSIESISGGRLTSKMRRSPSFFGMGRS